MFLDKCYRRAKQLATLLDSLTVYYNAVLILLFTWGVYAVFADESPNAVYTQASPTAYNVWLAWHIVAPPLSWIGQLIPAQRVQWWLRWAGDAGLFVLAATHLIAIHEEFGPSGDYLLLTPLLFTAIVLGLSTRDLMKALMASRGCDQ